jgi:hypothetical protein
MGNKVEKKQYKDEKVGVDGATAASEMGHLEDGVGLHRPRWGTEATLGELGDDTDPSIVPLVHGL